MCISRPRRFGKSMALEMLAAYYSKGCSSAELFQGLKVCRGNVPEDKKELEVSHGKMPEDKKELQVSHGKMLEDKKELEVSHGKMPEDKKDLLMQS